MNKQHTDDLFPSQTSLTANDFTPNSSKNKTSRSPLTCQHCKRMLEKMAEGIAGQELRNTFKELQSIRIVSSAMKPTSLLSKSYELIKEFTTTKRSFSHERYSRISV